MPLDPYMPPAGTPSERLADQIADLNRRLKNIEAFLQGGAVQQFPVVDALPTPGRKGRAVVLSSDSKLYVDNGTSWIAQT